MHILLFSLSFILFDPEFIDGLLDSDEYTLQALSDDSIPPEQNLNAFAQLADKLARWVPRSFLKENLTTSFPPDRGEVVRLEGNVKGVTKHDETATVYRCKMVLNDGTVVDIFVPSIPQAWKLNIPVQERAAALGLYVKSYKCALIFVAPAIEWYPDTWLGNIGFNVGSFDQVPVSRVVELEQNDEEMNRRMFKFTEADVEPFYGLLRAVSATTPGWLEEEAKKQYAEMPFNATDLFNRPYETRGKPILLRGTAKRVTSIPVTDGEVQSLFAIDRYYQIYLFTDQSRGNPIVVCVSSLPEGMPTGDGVDFAEQITVAAVPYKLWIYDTSTGPHYAPILVGRSVVWHQNFGTMPRVPDSVAAFSFTVFLILALAWFACRYWIKASRS